jgi:hydroxypyruvate isomerase
MPRFAANLQWLFTEHDFLDRFEAAHGAGFEAVEFPSPYDHPPEILAARLRESSVECILFNLPMGDRSKGDFGIACRPERVEEFRSGVATALRYAEALGCRRMNCIAGKRSGPDDPGKLHRTLVENLRYAARALAAAGRELVIEPINTTDVPGFLVPRQEDGARIIAEVAEPNFGLQCDLYHTAMMKDDPAAILERFMPIVRHVQFADAPGRGDPGTGTLDFKRLFSLIDRLGYRGWVSAEYRPSRATVETLAWRDG